MPLELQQSELDIVSKILKQYAPQAKYILFGSRAEGRAQKYSDLDIAIDAQKPLSLEILSKLEEAFSESTLPFKVDIVDYHRISPEFQEKIQSNFISI